MLKVMREEGMHCGSRHRREYRYYRGQIGTTAPNRLNRRLNSQLPMAKLVTDVTQFKVGDVKIHLSPIIDLSNDEVVSSCISRSPTMTRVFEMLHRLEGKLGDAHPLYHSDQE